MIVTGKSSNFVPAPEGLHHAVCVDVVDLGIVDNVWNNIHSKVHKLKIVWEIAATMASGDRFLISNFYRASLHQKSTLYKHLVDWRGRPFNAAEISGFDMENIIGAPCQLLVRHNEKDGTVFANIASILRADKTQILKPSGKYTRVKDRPQQPVQTQQTQQANGHQGSQQAAQPAAQVVDDIPF